VLALAAGAEADSEHPLARAIVDAAGELGEIPNGTDFEALTGLGVQATVGGMQIAVGGPRLLEHLGTVEPAEVRPNTE
jgi:Cu2+-exporting ATPase